MLLMHIRQTGAMFAKRFVANPSFPLLSMWCDFMQIPFDNRPISKIRCSNPINRDQFFSSSTPDSQPKRQKREHKVKIVINSVMGYRRPLTTLLESILESDYISLNRSSSDDNLPVPLDIIISLGKTSDTDLIARSPIIQPLNVIADVSSSYTVTVVYTSENNFDWTALHQLYQYRQHQLIAADYYLYLLDTCKVENHFWKKVLSKISMIGNDPYRERVMLTTKPHSSIAIFGSGIIENYQRNFRKYLCLWESVFCSYCISTTERKISKDDG